ncbi:hypothetical protein FHT91_006173 [Rhizobium sp. BK347]|nr:hypothetical protein [Rhizobium sp. BK252]MBB3404153.1 hypothetical protein [Rhizobium sp. BK289]MBB3418475.1 hypothetical protein [Rhizobium sp. BK284]MBB3486353.1 hypothetical protein [Rhizobium sp. BK347]
MVGEGFKREIAAELGRITLRAPFTKNIFVRFDSYDDKDILDLKADLNQHVVSSE